MCFSVIRKHLMQMGFLFDSARVQVLNHPVKMNNSGDRRRWPSWNNLKKRFGLKRISFMGCCGSSKWVLDDDIGEEPLINIGDQSPTSLETIVQESCIDHMTPDNSTITMNLATALAADRKRINVGQNSGNYKVKPLKSIFRLYEDFDHDLEVKVMDDDEDGGIGNVCSLCTERNKGVALIPCGHTYCRVCSRAMWLNKGSCPLCNRFITEILDIF